MSSHNQSCSLAGARMYCLVLNQGSLCWQDNKALKSRRSGGVVYRDSIYGPFYVMINTTPMIRFKP